MIELAKDLFSLYKVNNIEICNKYKEIVLNNLIKDLSYTSAIMEGLVKTLLNNKKMMAFNLIQNSIDEAKGAARIKIIAEKYAGSTLKAQMFKHVDDEMKHSCLFANLVKHTGFEVEKDISDENSKEVDTVFDFDNNLKEFICRVHSIEVRSWTMLRHYLRALDNLKDKNILKIRPTIEIIMKDEINHVCYTGKAVSDWLNEDKTLYQTFAKCINHTNKETWQDVINMSQFMYDNINEVMKSNNTNVMV